MSDVEELERRVAELENFYTDLPELMNLRLDRNDAAHAEHSARLSIIDKQLAALTRDLRDMRGGVTRQLTGQDQRLVAMEERIAAVEARLDTLERRLEAIERRTETIERRTETIERRTEAIERRQISMEEQLRAMAGQLTHITAILERK